MSDVINLSKLELDDYEYIPAPYVGRYSGKELAGLDLTLYVRTKRGRAQVEALNKQDFIEIDDPAVRRTYKATAKQTMSVFNDASPVRTYKFEVRELDVVSPFNSMEVEGQRFEVFAHKDTGYEMLLKLSPDEFSAFQKLAKATGVSIARAGVDDSPISVRLIHFKMWWSVYQEGDNKYYLQVVALEPPKIADEDDGTARKSALVTVADILSRHMALLDTSQRLNLERLLARQEALINYLTSKGILSTDEQSQLLDQDWNPLIDESTKDKFDLFLRQLPNVERIFEKF